jgi:hypothetical protein
LLKKWSYWLIPAFVAANAVTGFFLVRYKLREIRERVNNPIIARFR